jgi:hypothetical protein
MSPEGRTTVYLRFCWTCFQNAGVFTAYIAFFELKKTAIYTESAESCRVPAAQHTNNAVLTAKNFNIDTI